MLVERQTFGSHIRDSIATLPYFTAHENEERKVGGGGGHYCKINHLSSPVSMFCSASKQEIMNTPEFAKLCRKLKSQSRTFNINETVEALKIISYMGVHSSSIIVQTLLQLIRHQVNDLSLKQIVFLEFVLKRMKSSSLTDALRIALPLVFEAQLETKIDRSNPSQLAELLYYSAQTQCSDSCIELLLGALNDLHHELDINSAKLVVLS
ncbi:unnamed protein product, partial [Timema podura]|nr:unnamed protein product [Timema podura]